MNGIVVRRNTALKISGVNSVLEVKQYLFTDDTALVSDLTEKLNRSVSKFENVYERRELMINLKNIKGLRHVGIM